MTASYATLARDIAEWPAKHLTVQECIDLAEHLTSKGYNNTQQPTNPPPTQQQSPIDPQELIASLAPLINTLKTLGKIIKP